MLGMHHDAEGNIYRRWQVRARRFICCVGVLNDAGICVDNDDEHHMLA